MPAYQLLEPGRVYLDGTGLTIAAGGSLTFYQPDTTTEADTWSDPELVTLNPNPVLLNSAGRAQVSGVQVEMWGEDAYDIVLKDADGVTVWTRRVQPQVQEGGTIPTLEDGKFLTNNGTDLSWQAIKQVPDPTGLVNYRLASDGTSEPYWVLYEDPEVPDPEIVVGADSFQAGVSTDETKFLLQTGTGSAPATGLVNTTASVTFDTPFAATPMVFIQPTTDSNAGGPMVAEISSGPSTTGFTVIFTIAAGSLSSAVTLNAVPFNWLALGTVEVPA
jgi:hypothetical protein